MFVFLFLLKIFWRIVQRKTGEICAVLMDMLDLIHMNSFPAWKGFFLRGGSYEGLVAKLEEYMNDPHNLEVENLKGMFRLGADVVDRFKIPEVIVDQLVIVSHELRTLDVSKELAETKPITPQKRPAEEQPELIQKRYHKLPSDLESIDYEHEWLLRLNDVNSNYDNLEFKSGPLEWSMHDSGANKISWLATCHVVGCTYQIPLTVNLSPRPNFRCQAYKNHLFKHCMDSLKVVEII